MRSQKEKELQAFEAFLQASPSLAVQMGNNWCVQEAEGAYPDVLANLHDGQEIGFELGEWVHEDQIGHSKKTDQFAADILRAIEPQPKNTTQHIHCLMLVPRSDNTRFDQQDGGKLREELFRLIQGTDQQWPKERHWQSPQGYHCRGLDRFPTLARYLTEVWFDPRVTGKLKRTPRPHGILWIDVEGRGGAYSGESAREALQVIISKKASHYDGGPYGGPSGQRVNLLIHYGADAFTYNTPFSDDTTPDFAAVARFAGEVVQSCSRGRQFPFERVYLCNTLAPKLEAYEIFPRLIKSS